MKKPIPFDNDFYSRKAFLEKKRARSYYKIQELDQKFSLLNKIVPHKILDLGCSPGSWSQYIFERATHAEVMGVDLQEMRPFQNSNLKFHFIKKDIAHLDDHLDRLNFPIPYFDLILSDLAPKTTGERGSDAYHSYELVLKVLKIVDKWLKKDGCWVAKYFQGDEMKTLRKDLAVKNQFLKLVKPKATKKSSVELYWVGKKK